LGESQSAEEGFIKRKLGKEGPSLPARELIVVCSGEREKKARKDKNADEDWHVVTMPPSKVQVGGGGTEAASRPRR